MVFLILWQICCFQSQTTMLKWLRLPSRDLIRHFQSEYPSAVSSECPPGIDIAFRSEFCPQNTPILWTTRPKSELYPQNTTFLWMNRPFSSRLAVFSRFGVPLLVPFRDQTAVFLPNCPLQATRACTCKSPGKHLICNHLIISIIAKSCLPGEAKLVSPGRP